MQALYQLVYLEFIERVFIDKESNICGKIMYHLVTYDDMTKYTTDRFSLTISDSDFHFYE